MKKVVLMLLLACLFCSGCEKTTENNVMVSKKGGLDKNAISDKLSMNEKRTVDLPNQWVLNEEQKGGDVIIRADITLGELELSNTPIIEMENKAMTNDDLKTLVHYFAKEPIYEPRRKTVLELETMKARIDNKESCFANLGQLSAFKVYSDNLEKIIQTAPIGKEELMQSEIEFDERKSKLDEQRNIFFGREREVSEEANYFVAEVGQKQDTVIRSSTYSKQADTSSNFTYTKGVIYTEEDWRVMQENNQMMIDLQGADSFYGTTYQAYYNKMKQILDRADFDVELGRQQAEQVLKDLNIDYMTLLNEVKAIWIDQSFLPSSFYVEDILWNIEGNMTKSGYMYNFTREINGLSVDYKVNNYEADIPEEKYAAPFGVETISILVTEDGVQFFRWNNMSKEVKRVAENTHLDNFGDIQKKLTDYIFYNTAAESESQQGVGAATYEYEVTDVKLGYTYTQAYANTNNAWLTPTWFFTIHNKVEDGNVSWERVEDYIMLNAIDGGYISPNDVTIMNKVK